jgi:hypothetical protein
MKMVVSNVSSSVDATTTPDTRNHRIFMVEQPGPDPQSEQSASWSPNSCTIMLTASEASNYTVGTVVTVTVIPD